MKTLMRSLLLVTMSLGVLLAAAVPENKKTETKTTSETLFRLGTKYDPESLILGKSGDRCGEAWITIESNRDTVVLHWNVEHCKQDEEPDEIIFSTGTKSDPYNRSASWLFPLTRHSGGSHSISTSLPFDDQHIPYRVDGAYCLPYWIETKKSGVVLHKNCLAVQPTWMRDNYNQIGELPLTKLAIPGTHNAGSYEFNTELSIGDSDRWILCQDMSILRQLLFGIRYLDIRVGYYPLQATKLWLNHNLIRIRPLDGILREIRQFLDDTTHEVVIFDVHHLPVGFYSNNSPNPEAHAALTEMLQAELGPHISQRMSIDNKLTIKSIVDKKTRAVVSYTDESIQNKHNWLWPSVRHLWAKTNIAQQMLNFLDGELSTSHSKWNSAMCQTTPTALDILMGRGSIRGNAEDVSKPVDDRLRSNWAQNINIISPDFFMGSNIVSHCLRINLERSHARKLDSGLQTKDA